MVGEVQRNKSKSYYSSDQEGVSVNPYRQGHGRYSRRGGDIGTEEDYWISSSDYCNPGEGYSSSTSGEESDECDFVTGPSVNRDRLVKKEGRLGEDVYNKKAIRVAAACMSLIMTITIVIVIVVLCGSGSQSDTDTRSPTPTEDPSSTDPNAPPPKKKKEKGLLQSCQTFFLTKEEDE